MRGKYVSEAEYITFSDTRNLIAKALTIMMKIKNHKNFIIGRTTTFIDKQCCKRFLYMGFKLKMHPDLTKVSEKTRSKIVMKHTF